MQEGLSDKASRTGLELPLARGRGRVGASGTSSSVWHKYLRSDYRCGSLRSRIYSSCVSVRRCCCKTLHVRSSLSHPPSTKPPPPPNTTSPRDTIKGPGRKRTKLRTLRRDRLAGQFPSPPRLRKASWQEADGPRCQVQAAERSVSAQLAGCKPPTCRISLLALQ